MQWMVMLNKDGTKSICHSDLNDYLAHYGLPRRSGRYKWGSGKEPYQSLRVRRYQNSDGSLTKAGAKRYQYQRTLNDLDKKGTKTVAKYMKTEHRIYNDITKLKKQHQRYAGHPTERNNKRMEKTERKIDANFDKRDKMHKELEGYDSGIWKTTVAAVGSGYNVNGKTVHRNHDKSTYVYGTLFGMPGYISKQMYNQAEYAPRYNGQTPSSVAGYKWKVTRVKKKKK